MKSKLCLSVSVLAVVCSDAAYAQTASSSGSGVETVVVTAERRVENLMTAPITATVISGGDLQAKGVTGRGVDVAVIDSGIAPVPALSGPGKVVNAADISPDAAVAGQKFLDGLGGQAVGQSSIEHGTSVGAGRAVSSKCSRTNAWIARP